MQQCGSQPGPGAVVHLKQACILYHLGQLPHPLASVRAVNIVTLTAMPLDYLLLIGFYLPDSPVLHKKAMG